MRADFLWASDEDRARKLLLSPLLLAEGLYRAGAFLHRRAYETGLRRRVRVPARVVAIGNLTVGGSGKTPLVAWLARELRVRGGRSRFSAVASAEPGHAASPSFPTARGCSSVPRRPATSRS